MEFNDTKVGILEDKDFDGDGTLFAAKPVIVLIYASHCPYCKDEIPGFIQLAARGRDALCAAIPTDGPFADTALLQRLDLIVPNVQSVPTFALFRAGRFITKARQAKDLMRLL